MDGVVSWGEWVRSGQRMGWNRLQLVCPGAGWSGGPLQTPPCAPVLPGGVWSSAGG